MLLAPVMHWEQSKLEVQEINVMINVANWERILRIVVGALLFSLAFVGPQTLWGFLGVVPLLTGLSGFCPLYAVFGFSSCPTDNSHKPHAT